MAGRRLMSCKAPTPATVRKARQLAPVQDYPARLKGADAAGTREEHLDVFQKQPRPGSLGCGRRRVPPPHEILGFAEGEARHPLGVPKTRSGVLEVGRDLAICAHERVTAELTLPVEGRRFAPTARQVLDSCLHLLDLSRDGGLGLRVCLPDAGPEKFSHDVLADVVLQEFGAHADLAASAAVVLVLGAAAVAGAGVRPRSLEVPAAVAAGARTVRRKAVAGRRAASPVIEIAYRMYGEAPKQDSVRTVTLDVLRRALRAECRVIREQKRRQWPGEEKAWAESNRVRTHENGEPLHPDWISRRFSRLVEQSGLPPIRLHGTRHLSATPALLGKADIKVVQEWLGHSSHQNTSAPHTSAAHRSPRPPRRIPPARSYCARRRPPPARRADTAGEAGCGARGRRGHRGR
ncbi:tyrosine-type recombinase/integrase [Streptomyces celluloflavus]|uniref:tyrosine-type recombinase/integrase n=1 Tax=Streptomyces celluloflavus TaxID=58344 RepID=UPI00369B665F